MDQADARLINEIAKSVPFFSVAFFHAPTDQKQFTLRVESKKLYSLPYPLSYRGGLKNFFRIRNVLVDIQREHDLLIVQLPLVGFHSLIAIRKPVIYHICANVLSAAANKKKYSGLNSLAARSFAIAMHGFNKFLFQRKNVKLIVNGSELGRLYKKSDVTVVVSSSITMQEIVSVDSVWEIDSPAMKLLFIGRPSLQKGFDLLIEALLLLNTNNHKFILTVIGFDEIYFRENLFELYHKSKAIHSSIVYKGYMRWDEQMRQVVRESHILVVPSLGGEGTPRVILECMSQGVPCIASNMDGIPDIVEDGKDGLLFWPLKPEALLEKLQVLSSDKELRRKLSLAAWEKSKENTVEHFASYFTKALKEF